MTDAKLLGLRTVISAAPDLVKTKAWYVDALGVEPYFDQPFYVGSTVGGYELGLVPDAEPAQVNSADALTYWGVNNLGAVLTHWIELGATIHADGKEVGDAIKTAAVKDSFGNVVGLIENPHFSL